MNWKWLWSTKGDQPSEVVMCQSWKCLWSLRDKNRDPRKTLLWAWNKILIPILILLLIGSSLWVLFCLYIVEKPFICFRHTIGTVSVIVTSCCVAQEHILLPSQGPGDSLWPGGALLFSYHHALLSPSLPSPPPLCLLLILHCESAHRCSLAMQTDLEVSSIFLLSYLVSAVSISPGKSSITHCEQEVPLQMLSVTFHPCSSTPQRQLLTYLFGLRAPYPDAWLWHSIAHPAQFYNFGECLFTRNFPRLLWLTYNSSVILFFF